MMSGGGISLLSFMVQIVPSGGTRTQKLFTLDGSLHHFEHAGFENLVKTYRAPRWCTFWAMILQTNA